MHPLEISQSDVRELELSLSGIRVNLISLGAAIRSVEIQRDDGEWISVHLALPHVADYLDHALNPHLGSTIGRYANRIAGAKFRLDGEVFHLDANHSPNTLHGGTNGWDRHNWTVSRDESGPEGSLVEFSLLSPDGDQGFPGSVRATSTYEVTQTSIRMSYRAETDRPTVISMTNHGYWNLGPSETVADHVLRVPGSQYLPVDDAGVPLGGLADVEGTPFDLRAPTRVGNILEQIPGGLDHCFSVEHAAGKPESPDDSLALAAVVQSPETGIWMSVHTDQPGVQAYTGNNLNSPFRRHGSVSLETQRFPDTPNRPKLGNARLDPGDQFSATTELAFGSGPLPH